MKEADPNDLDSFLSSSGSGESTTQGGNAENPQDQGGGAMETVRNINEGAQEGTNLMRNATEFMREARRLSENIGEWISPKDQKKRSEAGTQRQSTPAKQPDPRYKQIEQKVDQKVNNKNNEDEGSTDQDQEDQSEDQEKENIDELSNEFLEYTHNTVKRLNNAGYTFKQFQQLLKQNGLSWIEAFKYQYGYETQIDEEQIKKTLKAQGGDNNEQNKENTKTEEDGSTDQEAEDEDRSSKSEDQGTEETDQRSNGSDSGKTEENKQD